MLPLVLQQATEPSARIILPRTLRALANDSGITEDEKTSS
jgi:hypothetical protein